jgi:ribosomal protein L19E
MAYIINDGGVEIKCSTLKEFSALRQKIAQRSKREGRSEAARKSIGSGQARVWGFASWYMAWKNVDTRNNARSVLAKIRKEDPIEYAKLRTMYQNFLKAYAAKKRIKTSEEAQDELQILLEASREEFTKLVKSLKG